MSRPRLKTTFVPLSPLPRASCLCQLAALVLTSFFLSWIKVVEELSFDFGFDGGGGGGAVGGVPVAITAAAELERRAGRSVTVGVVQNLS